MPITLGSIKYTEPSFKQRDKQTSNLINIDHSSLSTDTEKDYAQKVVTATPQAVNDLPLHSDKELLKKTAERVNREPALIDKKLRFKVHEGTGKLFVEVTNNDNGKVLAEIPPKALLDLEARLKTDDVPPLLVNSKV